MDYQRGKIIIFSGAGISAESGLTTFRDEGGLWASYDPNVVCNYYNWLDNYEIVHEFYNKRRTELATKKPNAAHEAIKRLCDEFEVINITQNVDDLFEKAGCRNVIHLHGHLTSLRCVKCEAIIDFGYAPYKYTPCPKCGAEKLKPNIIFFGESAPKYATMYGIFERLTPNDIALVVGTSGEVVNICAFLRESQCYKILNNLTHERMIREEEFDSVYLEPSTSAIARICKEIRRLKGRL